MKTIYFVHDQEESPAARQNFLEMAGFQVRLISGGRRELLVALKEERPDLIVMDVLIDGCNGFELCKEVSTQSIPILLCSRIYRGRVFRDEALNSGANDYILMPTSLDDLVKRVNVALETELEAGGAPDVAA